MSQLGTVFRAKLHMGRHLIASVRHESKLKVGVVGVSAVVLWIGAFAVFHSGFGWLIRFGGRAADFLPGAAPFSFGDLLMHRSLGIFALAVFVLLIFSNVLVAFSTLYRSRESAYLLQSPVSFRQFFYMRFFECVLFSSWSLAYLGSPLMLAYGLTTSAPLGFFLAVVLFFVPYIIIPAALGCIIAMALVRVFPRLRVSAMVVLGGVAVAIFFLYIAPKFRHANPSDEAFLQAFIEATARTQSHLLPSFWASQGLLATADAQFGQAVFFFLLLLSNALFVLWLAGELAQRLLYPGWSYLQGQDRRRVKPEGAGVLGRLDAYLGWLANPHRVLVVKDVKLFWRDPTQWSQFVIFFGVMAVYIANLRNTSRFYEAEVWRGWVAALNVGAVLLILATLTSRFIFPLVSLEGPRFWILRLAPISIRQLVWQKFWLSVCITAVFTVGLAILSGLMLQLEPAYFVLTVYGVLSTNFGLAGLAVGLGALYPTFTEDNPARIVSGMGGTLNLLISVGYITLVVIAQTLVLQWRTLDLFQRPEWFNLVFIAAMVFIGLLGLVCTVAPMRLGLNNLNRMEL